MDGRFDKAVRDMLSLEDEAVLLTSAADLVLQEYVLSAPTMSVKHFGLFCRTFARLAPRSQDITYQAAEAALARRASSVENEQPELFDEVRQQVFRGDAGGLAALAAAIGRETGARQPLCPGFADRTQRFFARQAWHHSFTDDEIRRLRETLTEEYPNPQIRGIFAAAAAEAEQIQRQKRERDINMLNRWAFAFKSDDLLKKLSFRNTYVNLLYERLVREHEIKNIVPEEHYRRHRLIVQRQIRELTGTLDAKGKEICRKYAINKVYKAVAGNDKFKLQSAAHALEKYEGESFYPETTAVLSALDGGIKNRDVRLPQKPYRGYD